MKTQKLILLLFFTSPLFFWQIKNQTLENIGHQVRNVPAYISIKTTSLLSTETIRNIKEYRRDLENPLSRIFYNKATIIFPEVFHYFNILKPRIYFQSGTGDHSFPSNTEPLPIMLLPFACLGFYHHIKKQKYRSLALFAISPVLAFITGQYNFIFLLPTIYAYLHFSAYGIKATRHPKKIIISCFIYSLFLFLKNTLIYEI